MSASQTHFARFERLITDAIIDCVSPDNITLRACAIVCQSWRSQSQKRLLSTINLHSQENLSRFLQFLPNFSSHTRALVQTICFEPRTAASPSMVVTRRDVVAILDHLPGVDEMLFSRVQLDGTDKDACGPGFIPRSIHHLSFLDYTGTPEPADVLWSLMSFLQLFYFVRELHIQREDISDPEMMGGLLPNGLEDLTSRIYPSRPLHLRVHELLLRGGHLETHLLRFLRLTGAVRSLRRVHVKVFRPENYRYLQLLLADDPSIIEVLFLDLRYDVLGEFDYLFPQMLTPGSAFSNLRRLLIAPVMHTWFEAASEETCMSMLHVLEHFAGAPQLFLIKLRFSVQWEIPEGEQSHLAFLLDIEPKRRDPSYAFEMMHRISWERLQALEQYESLTDLSLEVKMRRHPDMPHPRHVLHFLCPLKAYTPTEDEDSVVQLHLVWHTWDENCEPAVYSNEHWFIEHNIPLPVED